MDKNYTKEQIESLLDNIKNCVQNDQYVISKNKKRNENIQFENEYQITKEKQKEILLNIQPEDFCYPLQNEHPNFKHETLYVFCPQVPLRDVCDEEELVDIYTKFNLIENDNNQQVVVISFHKRNKPIDYMFR